MNYSLADFQNIHSEQLVNRKISLDVLRLDRIHPVVSGNKWFKLKYYLEEAVQLKASTVATFGGAWSNHIVAVAYACKEASLESIGIIRGEKPVALSAALKDAENYGMKLFFVSRQEYKDKQQIISNYGNKDWYWINEGGYGQNGTKGAAEISSSYDLSSYSHIIAAVGTGTMVAGLIGSSHNEQQIIGISATKGNLSLKNEILFLLDKVPHENKFELFHDYHFGGFGRHPDEFINFLNQVYLQHNLPLDIVYTGKTFFAIEDLLKKNHFSEESKLLMIHSGGLQGNKSLGDKVLAY